MTTVPIKKLTITVSFKNNLVEYRRFKLLTSSLPAKRSNQLS